MNDRVGHLVNPTMVVAEGGAATESSWAAQRMVQSYHERGCPHFGVVVEDFCEATGRTVEFPPSDFLPGRYLRRIVPGIDPREVVRRHRDDVGFRPWTAVDPGTVERVPKTDKLGGYACPPAVRLASLMDKGRDEFLSEVGKMGDALREPAAGWCLRSNVLNVFIIAGTCGAVGRNGMYMAADLKRVLSPPHRFIYYPLLMSERGRVPDRTEAAALEHTFLAEAHHRYSAKDGGEQ